MDYIILHDYDAQESDELTIRKGDIIKNVHPHEDGWLKGTLRNVLGVFPDNFGKEYHEQKEPSKNDSIDESKEPSTDEELDSGGKKNKKVIGVGFGDIFAGAQIKLKSTGLSEAKNKPPGTVTVSSQEEPKSERVLHSNTKGEMVKVLFSYTPENKDELGMEVGEILTIVDKDCGDDGWWLGRNSKGKTGVFPNNYVEPVADQTTKDSTNQLELNQKNDGKDSTNQLELNQKNDGHENQTNALKPHPKPPPSISPKPSPVRPPNITKPKASTIEDAVNFDNSNNHVPLSCPSASRPKGPNKRLPGNVQSLYVANDHQPPAPSSNADKPRKPANNPVEPPTVNAALRGHSDSRKLSDDKTALFKQDTSGKDVEKLEAKVHSLETKVVRLEETNAEMSERMNKQSDQILHLTHRLQKLVKEIDDEKTKSVKAEVELKRIKDTVEQLEFTFMTKGANH